MQRRHFIKRLGAAGMLGVLGCSPPLPPLRIAAHPWSGYEFMFLGRQEGWFATEEVRLIEAPSATDSLARLSAGEADGAALTLDEVLRAREQGLALMVVLVFDISVGADVVLAHSDIRTLAELKGRRIGYEASGLGALMLHKLLEAAGLAMGDVQPAVLTPDQHVSAWQGKQVDALITYDPAASQLLGLGAHHLFDSSRLPDTIIDVLAVLPAAAERQGKALRRLIAAHFQGLTHFRKNPLDTAYRLSGRLGLPPREVIGSFKGLELPGVLRNHQLLASPHGQVHAHANEVAAILRQAAILKQANPDLRRLASADFLPSEAPQ